MVTILPQAEYLQQIERDASALERCTSGVEASLAAGALRMAEEQARKGTDAAESCSEWYAHDCAVLFDTVFPMTSLSRSACFRRRNIRKWQAKRQSMMHWGSYCT